jgi:hypothetical protein
MSDNTNNVGGEQYTVPQVAMTLASSSDATSGGLFYDGTIGVYNNTSNDSTKNIQLMKGHTVPAGYSSCDRWIGGSINTASINATLGANCAGLTYPPFKARYVTILSNPNNADGWLQISQVAVFAHNPADGSIINVASIKNNPKAKVTNGQPNNIHYEWRWWSNIERSIDGVSKAKHWREGFYHSATPGPYEKWQLDLSQEYDILQVVYYNRLDCCQERAIGTTLILENQDRTKKISKIMNGSLEQVFSIADEDSVSQSSAAPRT